MITFISRSSFCETLPLGPSTATRPSWAFTFTLSGILMVSLPMRDMGLSLPDGGDELAAEVLLARLAVDQHAFGGGEDGDAEAVHHLGDLGVPHVAAQPRLRLPPDLADGGALALVVLEHDVEGALHVVLLEGHFADESLLAQHLADALLHLAGGEIELLQPRALRVADAGQEIGHRIGHAHFRLPPPAVPVGAPALKSKNIAAKPPARPRLPGRLDHPCDFALEGAIAKADAAHLELVEERPAAAAELAARVRPHPELRLLLQALRLRDLGELGHVLRRPEGHAHVLEESAALFVAPRRGDDGDVHALDLLDAVVVDLGEDDLLLDAERVVPLAVEGLAGDPLEVAHAGQRDVEQAVEELVHPVLAQRGHDPDGLVLAQLEVGDALARAG